jgi:hypothetical protein
MAEETLRVNDRLSVFLRAWAPKGSPREVLAFIAGWMDTRAA